MTGSIFDGLADKDVARIKAAATPVSVPAGWSPIWEGTPADKAYIIESGQVSVRRHGQEIAQLGPGDIVGETSIVNHTLRTATIVSLSELRLLHLSKERLEQLSAELPAFHAALEQAAHARMSPHPDSLQA